MQEDGEMKLAGRPFKRTAKQNEKTLLAHFCGKSTAKGASDITGISRQVVNIHYRRFREAIFKATLKPPRFKGEIEIDEKWFGRRKKPRPKRIREPGQYLERIRYAPEGKVLVLGILVRDKKKGSRVYLQIIKDLKRRTLLPIIHMIVEGRSKIYTDGLKSYNTLKKSKYRHVQIVKLQKKRIGNRVFFTKTFRKGPGEHVNNIESFWGVSSNLLKRFQGISRVTFPLHIKELEFRHNFKDKKGSILPAMKALLK